MAEPPVVVVGQIARDLVLVVDDVPGPGGTVDVDRRRELLGGKGANIAVGLAQLGVPVAVVGVVGDDLVGAEPQASATPRQRGRRARTESPLMVDVVTADRQWRYFVSAGALLTPGDIEQAAGLWNRPQRDPAAAAAGGRVPALDRLDPRRVILRRTPAWSAMKQALAPGAQSGWSRPAGPTGTSGYAATSTKASRTTFPGRT